MASVLEIVTLEDSNTCTIYLYSEGMFYKAYQRSAFMFIRDHNKFKPIKKYIKSIGREVVSIGFPKSSVHKYCDRNIAGEDNDNVLKIQCDEIDLEAYDQWIDSITITEKAVVEGFKQADTVPIRIEPLHINILRKLRDFRIDTASPIECMLFIGTLQKELDKEYGNL